MKQRMKRMIAGITLLALTVTASPAVTQAKSYKTKTVSVVSGKSVTVRTGNKIKKLKICSKNKKFKVKKTGSKKFKVSGTDVGKQQAVKVTYTNGSTQKYQFKTKKAKGKTSKTPTAKPQTTKAPQAVTTPAPTALASPTPAATGTPVPSTTGTPAPTMDPEAEADFYSNFYGSACTVYNKDGDSVELYLRVKGADDCHLYDFYGNEYPEWVEDALAGCKAKYDPTDPNKEDYSNRGFYCDSLVIPSMDFGAASLIIDNSNEYSLYSFGGCSEYPEKTLDEALTYFRQKYPEEIYTAFRQTEPGTIEDAFYHKFPGCRYDAYNKSGESMPLYLCINGPDDCHLYDFHGNEYPEWVEDAVAECKAIYCSNPQLLVKGFQYTPSREEWDQAQGTKPGEPSTPIPAMIFSINGSNEYRLSNYSNNDNAYAQYIDGAVAYFREQYPEETYTAWKQSGPGSKPDVLK